MKPVAESVTEKRQNCITNDRLTKHGIIVETIASAFNNDHRSCVNVVVVVIDISRKMRSIWSHCKCNILVFYKVDNLDDRRALEGFVVWSFIERTLIVELNFYGSE